MPKPPRRTAASLGRTLGLTAFAGAVVLGAASLGSIGTGSWPPPLPGSLPATEPAESSIGEEAVPSEDPDAPVGLTVAPAEFVPATPDHRPSPGYTTVATPGADREGAHGTVGEHTAVHVTVANRTDGELEVSPSHFALVDASGARHDSADGAGAAEDQISTLTLLPRQATSGTVSAPGSFTPASVEMLEAPHGDTVHEAPVQH
ncbi:hypothetical protein IDM40_13375 [Nocardiopsis sp. HNM0947]|uniref:DUF4352 domain-containing protein n=1 Tax=Nocardiopsis coralli TaxID=2772213 RepID=A0ABR9P774_9ACTN|nr:hypothetical protein [Nocardiopsis coralli]MBE2999692.1 hypothetical protein [Nocardiopsis coralli]